METFAVGNTHRYFVSKSMLKFLVLNAKKYDLTSLKHITEDEEPLISLQGVQNY